MVETRSNPMSLADAGHLLAESGQRETGGFVGAVLDDTNQLCQVQDRAGGLMQISPGGFQECTGGKPAELPKEAYGGFPTTCILSPDEYHDTLKEIAPGEIPARPICFSSCDTNSFYKDWKVTAPSKLRVPAFIADQLLSEQRIAEFRASLPSDLPDNCELTHDVITEGCEEAAQHLLDKPAPEPKRCPLRKKAVQVGIAGVGVLLGALLSRHKDKGRQKRCRERASPSSCLRPCLLDLQPLSSFAW